MKKRSYFISADAGVLQYVVGLRIAYSDPAVVEQVARQTGQHHFGNTVIDPRGRFLLADAIEIFTYLRARDYTWQESASRALRECGKTDKEASKIIKRGFAHTFIVLHELAETQEREYVELPIGE